MGREEEERKKKSGERRRRVAPMGRKKRRGLVRGGDLAVVVVKDREAVRAPGRVEGSDR